MQDAAQAVEAPWSVLRAAASRVLSEAHLESSIKPRPLCHTHHGWEEEGFENTVMASSRFLEDEANAESALLAGRA